jgi:PAS domain-containing protein
LFLFVCFGSHRAGRRIYVGTMTQKNKYDKAQEMRLLGATKLILSDIANPAIVITKRGSMKVFNSAAEALLGYKEADVLNKNVKILMPEEFASVRFFFHIFFKFVFSL